MASANIVILYTIAYREGGEGFRRAALTLARAKRDEFPEGVIRCEVVPTKRAFVGVLGAAGEQGDGITELHFIGHSGLYGIMFGTTAWPEQMSPHEWRQLRLRFGPAAQVWFRSCRSGRWFAPFFARTFGVRTHGYFWYTTLSRRSDVFAWDLPARSDAPLHIVSVPGRKSHGLIGSLAKHFTRPGSYPMLAFEPSEAAVDTTYDSVAALYDETFDDISVRQDELCWLRAALSRKPPGRLLDIGCGTGSFLRATDDLVTEAHGVDLSEKMIERARARSPKDAKVTYSRIDGPTPPFEDSSFDVVSSVLSFRYLDWDPIIAEILRVLKPGGRLLVVDMVAAPLNLAQWPRFVGDKLRQQSVLRRNTAYAAALRRMVNDPRWKRMVANNPIRAEHELRWYLQSRFPGGKLSVLNVGHESQVLAFESAPIHAKQVEPLSYP